MTTATIASPTRPPLPPGSSGLLWGTLLSIRDPYGWLARCARRYGDPFTLRSVVGTMVFTGHPDGVRTIFSAPPEQYAPMGAELLSPVLGANSMLFLDGDRHRAARRLVTPPFHGARMRAYGRIMQDATLARVREWQRGRPFAMQRVTQSISLDVILHAVFGVADEARRERFRSAIAALMRTLSPTFIFFKALRRDLGGLSAWSRFCRARAALRALLVEEIDAARRAPAEREDILGLLVAARYEDGSPMSDDELCEQLTTLLGAGHETTAIALVWACHFLHRSPAALERLRAELAPLGDRPEPEEVARLPYLEAVCHETLRLRPVTTIVGRMLARPLDLQGWTIPPGVNVAASVCLVHEREDLYPDHERFHPERFLERAFSPFEFLPFGGGTRRCIGSAFALYEMKLVLATMLAGRRLRLVRDAPVRAAMRSNVVGPVGGVEMILD
jgi:cytochrome P450